MDSQIVCERCDRTDCVSVVHDHLDALIPCQACRREDGFPFVCDGKPVDWRARLAEVERERDAANARAEKAEAALAKVAERLAMAKVFDVGDGVTIERSRSGYYIERQVQPRGRRWMTEFLLPAGIWQRRTLHCFPDVDAALAALAVSRG